MCNIVTNWENWVVGIFSSAIPMGITVLFGYLKWWQPYSRLKKMGVEKIFRNQEEGKQSILTEIKSSNKLYVFAMRGETFSDKTNSRIAEVALGRTDLKQHYLISSLDNEYLKSRANELEDDDLIDSVRKSISCLTRASKEHYNIKLRLHKEIVRFRIILLDNYLFLSFMEEKRAKQTDILKINKNSPLYKTFSTIFDELWGKY